MTSSPTETGQGECCYTVEHRRFDLNLTEIQARVNAGIEHRRFDLNLTEIQAMVSTGIEHRRF